METGPRRRRGDSGGPTSGRGRAARLPQATPWAAAREAAAAADALAAAGGPKFAIAAAGADTPDRRFALALGGRSAFVAFGGAAPETSRHTYDDARHRNAAVDAAERAATDARFQIGAAIFAEASAAWCAADVLRLVALAKPRDGEGADVACASSPEFGAGAALVGTSLGAGGRGFNFNYQPSGVDFRSRAGGVELGSRGADFEGDFVAAPARKRGRGTSQGTR